MNQREAKLRALSDAAQMLGTSVDGGYPDDLEDSDAGKVQDAMRDLANELGRRFAKMVHRDMRKARTAQAGPKVTQ